MHSDPPLRRLSRVCVFCGSSPGSDPDYRRQAAHLGRLLAQRRIGLVYGGGRVGLMGVVADAALAEGGEVIGVIPQALADKELAHSALSQLHVVPDMHARKAMMSRLSDGFVALPGGFGTLEELFEVITWAQLGLQRKPIGILNVGGYFDGLLRFMAHAITQGFVPPEHRDLLLVDTDPDALVAGLWDHPLPQVKQWITPSQT